MDISTYQLLCLANLQSAYASLPPIPAGPCQTQVFWWKLSYKAAISGHLWELEISSICWTRISVIFSPNSALWSYTEYLSLNLSYYLPLDVQWLPLLQV